MTGQQRRHPDEDWLQAFFFEAMQKGYASSAPRKPFPGLPGSKCITYERERHELKLADIWFAKPSSDSSHGVTLIWVADSLVWAMHYGGWYNRLAIPFLKRALARNYEQSIFEGGRGPTSLEGEDHTLQYLNTVEKKGFVSFRGHDRIIVTSVATDFVAGEVFGEHHYFGGLML